VTDWRAAYAGYDDGALALLANAGLVRRAAKVLAAGSVQLGDDGQATVDGARVHLDSRGPAKAVCGCPATGVCVHILAASMAARGATSTGDVDVLAELLGTSPSVYCAAAGVAAVRAAQAEVGAATVSVDGPRALISLPEVQGPVVFVSGGGFAGMVSDVAPARRAAVHLAALARLFAAHGRPWTWPVSAAERVEVASRSDTLDLTVAALATTIGAGLSRATDESSDRLEAVAVRARADGLPLLSRLLSRAAGLVAELADRSDSSRELEVALALAEVWALAAALRVDERPELVGEVRRASVSAEAVDLVPLGARWFTTPSGSRGVTVFVTDRASGELHAVTTSRPSGSDPAFRRDPSVSLIWNSSVARLAAGPFRLSQLRLTADGSIAPSTTSRVDPLGTGLDGAELAALATRRWSELPAGPAVAGFGATRSSSALLAPSAAREPFIDEVSQHLVWPLVDEEGAVLETRIPLDSRTHIADAIATVVEAKARLAFVLVHTGLDGTITGFEPSSIVLTEKTGLTLYPLDFLRPPTPKASKLSALRKRLERQFASLSAPEATRATRASVAPLGAVGGVCAAILEVLEQVAATGSRSLSPRQRSVLRDQAAVAAELALGSVVTAVLAVAEGEHVDASSLYRCLFVVDRARNLDGAL